MTTRRALLAAAALALVPWQGRAADAAALEAAARTDPRITELLAGRRIVKVIAVPGRLVNFVVEG